MRKKSSDLPTVTDRRCEQRFPARGQIRYLPTRAAKDWRFLAGRVVDCSAHGIGMECEEPLGIGDDFIVKLRMGKMRLAVYRVQNVASKDGSYRIGGEFIGMLIDPGDVDHEAI